MQWISKSTSSQMWIGFRRGKRASKRRLATSPRGWTNQMTNVKAAAKIYQHLALGEQQFPSLFKQLLKLFKQPACSSSSSSTMSACGTLNTVAKVIKFLLYKNLNNYTQWRQKGWDDPERLKLHKRKRGKEGYRNTCADVYLNIKGACVSLYKLCNDHGCHMLKK